jgi:hypothetical protein
VFFCVFPLFCRSDITGQQGNISFPATLSKVQIVQIICEVVRVFNPSLCIILANILVDWGKLACCSVDLFFALSISPTSQLNN